MYTYVTTIIIFTTMNTSACMVRGRFIYTSTHNNYTVTPNSSCACFFSEDLKQLVHLKYCIKESLRLFPPVSAVARVLDQDTNITGYDMPKGTSVVLFIYAIHRNPDFWENPDVRNKCLFNPVHVCTSIHIALVSFVQEFDPLRFTPENSKGRHPHAFVPFSAGPR